MGKQVRKDLLIQRTGRKLFRELLFIKHLKVAQQQYFIQITLIWFTHIKRRIDTVFLPIVVRRTARGTFSNY